MVSLIEPSPSRKAKRKQSKLPKGARKAGFPGFIAPALASLRKTPPVGAHWLHEIKFDGYRLQAHIRPKRVKLLTRSGLDWTAKFGEAIAVGLANLNVQDAIIDGEIVAEPGGGTPDFSALQDALATGHTERLVFYAFDLLYLDGYDLRSSPLIERKAALLSLVTASTRRADRVRRFLRCKIQWAHRTDPKLVHLIEPREAVPQSSPMCGGS